MKKNYTAPEAGLLCFAPVEDLANGNEINFGALIELNGNGTGMGAAKTESSDIKITI